MMLQVTGSELAAIKASWRTGAVQNPCLFHCQVMAAAGAAVAFSREEAMTNYFSDKRVEHRLIANELIANELETINQGTSEPTSELILAVLNLATSSGDVDEWTGEDLHPKSPLGTGSASGQIKSK